MTISSTNRVAGPYTGDGLASSFPFYFKVFAATELAVYKVNTDTAITTTLVYGTDYTVVLNDESGTVTLTAGALASNYTLTITSDISNTQPIDLTNQGGFYPDVLNNGFDRATMQIQQLQEGIVRSLRYPVTVDTAGVSAELPVPLASYLLGWNEAADAITNVSPTSLAPFIVYGTGNWDTFAGNGVQVDFVLSNNPVALGNLSVSINGVTQSPGFDYNYNGLQTVSFTTAPPLNSSILIKYQQGLVQGNTDYGLITSSPLSSSDYGSLY